MISSRRILLTVCKRIFVRNSDRLAVYARYKQDGLLPEWTEEQKRRLLKEKLCFNCGQPNHRAKDCSERKADPASFTFNNLVLEEAEVSDDMGLPLN